MVIMWYIQSGGSSGQPCSYFEDLNKYANITDTNIFIPIAIESESAWDQQAIEFIQELGNWISVVTKESKET